MILYHHTLRVEKPLNFAPFDQVDLPPWALMRLPLLGKIRLPTSYKHY